MGFGSIFGKKKDSIDIGKLDLFRIKDQIISDGDAIILADKDTLPIKLMYITDDVMNSSTLQIDKILAKNGYQHLELKSFDGYIFTGEVKGHYFQADQLIAFKKTNGFNK